MNIENLRKGNDSMKRLLYKSEIQGYCKMNGTLLEIIVSNPPQWVIDEVNEHNEVEKKRIEAKKWMVEQ